MTTQVSVPFVDLHAQYMAHKQAFDSAFTRVIDCCAFVGGVFVKAFEAEFAEAMSAKHCISVANGTDAIYIVLKMLSIGPGDEVIVPAVSWISTSEVVTQTGATVVFADIDEFHTIDPDDVERKISSKTKALIAVHLYGQPAPIDRLAKICRRNNVHLIEDCAQAHLATYDGKSVGSFGVAGTFSFYPGKNLGAYGDAGAIITNDDELATRCRMFANHGALVKHQHEMEGINSRLDGLQASLLSAKLPFLADWNASRSRVAQAYDEILRDVVEVTTPRIREHGSHVFHLYVIRTGERDSLMHFLNEQGIQTQVHYPTPLPYLPAYKYLSSDPDEFPVAKACSSEILSLPIYPELTNLMVEQVCEQIARYFRR